jgi:hypothetical protein
MDDFIQLSNTKIGYDENDYVTVRQEYPNCIHDWVAPKDYQRAEWKKP